MTLKKAIGTALDIAILLQLRSFKTLGENIVICTGRQWILPSEITPDNNAKRRLAPAPTERRRHSPQTQCIQRGICSAQVFRNPDFKILLRLKGLERSGSISQRTVNKFVQSTKYLTTDIMVEKETKGTIISITQYSRTEL